MRKKKGVKEVSVYYLPWWVLFACLPAGAFVVYFALHDSALSRRALFTLTAVLAQLLLFGAAVAALAVSMSLSVLHERLDRCPRASGTDRESAPHDKRPSTAPVTTDSTASPTTSPTASPTASSTSFPFRKDISICHSVSVRYGTNAALSTMSTG